jgi:ABC-2 type transport system ATP-binding protein
MAVEARGLGKRFGEVWGLREATFELGKRFVGVLAGPNGAGKTTTTRILATYYRPDKGEAYVCGFDVVKEYREVRRVIAYMPQEYRVSLDLTPEELIVANLMKRGISYFDARREARRWLEALGMWELRKRRLWVLSGGERRRALVASVLAEPAEVYFLDEPTTGIDVEGRYEVLKVVREAVSQGATVFMTTHNLSEARVVADTVVFISSGVTVAAGNPQELLESFPWRFKAFVNGRGELPGDVPHIRLGDRQVIYARAREELYELLKELKVDVHGVYEVDLEDVYLQVVRGRQP